MFSGLPVVCRSADSVYCFDDACRYPLEFLNTLEVPGLPSHKLTLKPGMPIILLRNLQPSSGLCNGARLVVQKIMDHRVVFAKLADSESSEQVVIPRISLIINESDRMPFKWRRRQFPVKQAFSMTINKVQGQTLDRLAVWLEDPVFAHGQLYVAASRISDPQNVRFYVNATDQTENNFVTTNCVYREVLDA